MASDSDDCSECNFEYNEFIATFYSNESLAYEFFRAHNVLPKAVYCPICKTPCLYQEIRREWYCSDFSVVSGSKKRKPCDFVTSDYKGTILEGNTLPIWQILLFCNEWLRKTYDHETIIENLNWSDHSVAHWESICSKVTSKWLKNQQQIGGEQIIVEIDKYKLFTENSKTTWLFGGYERISKKFFLVPIVEETEDKMTEKIVSIIKKSIYPGSIIISNPWKPFESLVNEEYIHWVTTGKFVNPDNPTVNTQCIRRLWRDVKEWLSCSNFKPTQALQYLPRYLFINDCCMSKRVHLFFKEAAQHKSVESIKMEIMSEEFFEEYEFSENYEKDCLTVKLKEIEY